MKKVLDIGICSAVLVSEALSGTLDAVCSSTAPGRWIWPQRVLLCLVRLVELSIHKPSIQP